MIEPLRLADIGADHGYRIELLAGQVRHVQLPDVSAASLDKARQRPIGRPHGQGELAGTAEALTRRRLRGDCRHGNHRGTLERAGLFWRGATGASAHRGRNCSGAP